MLLEGWCLALVQQIKNNCIFIALKMSYLEEPLMLTASKKEVMGSWFAWNTQGNLQLQLEEPQMLIK